MNAQQPGGRLLRTNFPAQVKKAGLSTIASKEFTLIDAARARFGTSVQVKDDMLRMANDDDSFIVVWEGKRNNDAFVVFVSELKKLLPGNSETRKEDPIVQTATDFESVFPLISDGDTVDVVDVHGDKHTFVVTHVREHSLESRMNVWSEDNVAEISIVKRAEKREDGFYVDAHGYTWLQREGDYFVFDPSSTFARRENGFLREAAPYTMVSSVVRVEL